MQARTVSATQYKSNPGHRVSRLCRECDHWVAGRVGIGECHHDPITASGWPPCAGASQACSQWVHAQRVFEHTFHRLDPESLEQAAMSFTEVGPYRMVEVSPKE